MGRAFASGKYSWGICDRCGARARYREMREQVINSAPSGLRVCRDCLDVDHPQLKLNRVRIDDPQALRFARPEIDLDEQRLLFGLVLGVSASGGVGRLTPVIS